MAIMMSRAGCFEAGQFNFCGGGRRFKKSIPTTLGQLQFLHPLDASCKDRAKRSALQTDIHRLYFKQSIFPEEVHKK